MYEDTGGSSLLGTISLGTGLLGLLGQGCCCVPLVSIFATLFVPVLILTSIGTGIAGAMQGGRGRGAAIAGLALGIFDALFLTAWYGGMILLYGGLVVLGNL